MHGASQKRIFDIELSGLVVKNAKKEKKIFFVLLLINLTNSNYDPQTNFLCWWVIITEKKIKKSDYQKCNHACIMHVLTAHHSKAHRSISINC